MGLFDALSAQTPQGAQLRSGLLGMASGLLSGSTGNYGQFGPALGQGFAGFAAGTQNAARQQLMDQRAQMLQTKMAHDAQLRSAQQDLMNRIGGQGGQSTQGGLENVPFPDLLRAAMMGVPGAKEALDFKKWSAGGIERKPGATYINPVNGQERYMPKLGEGITTVGGRASAVPGYADANAEIQGKQTAAQEGAKASFDLVPVPLPDGSTQMMPRSMAVKAFQGGPGMAPGIFGRSQSPADQAYNVETSKANAAMYNKMQDSARAASGQIATYKQIGDLLKGFEGGSLSMLGLQGAKLANSIGLKLDPNLDAKEAAVALSNQAALELRNPASGAGMPGAMSDSDRAFLSQSVPNLSQSAGGRQKLIDYKVRVLERQQTVAEMARRWRQQYGRLDTVDENGNDFQTALSMWADENPLFSGEQAAMPSAPPDAIDYLRQNPNLADAFDAKYGAGSAARILGQ